MKVIIAGGRDIQDLKIVGEAILQCPFGDEIKEVVHGGASGVDWLAKMWAIRNGVTIKAFYADWDKNGRAAGPIRNREMAGYADALIAIWDGKSPGTKNMILEAKKKRLQIYIHRI